jgi:hypothetical protein
MHFFHLLFFLICHMVTARAIQACLLIISGWDQFVNIEKLVEITGTVSVTLKFHPIIFLFFGTDFT